MPALHAGHEDRQAGRHHARNTPLCSQEARGSRHVGGDGCPSSRTDRLGEGAIRGVVAAGHRLLDDVRHGAVVDRPAAAGFRVDRRQRHSSPGGAKHQTGAVFRGGGRGAAIGAQGCVARISPRDCDARPGRQGNGCQARGVGQRPAVRHRESAGGRRARCRPEAARYGYSPGPAREVPHWLAVPADHSQALHEVR